MSEPFVAEIRILAIDFAPTGWAKCDGQLLPLSQNTALFSLLGTQYGGNGMNNFALPDLRDRMPMHPGQGPGLSYRNPAEAGGEAGVTLNPSEMPQHAHQLMHSGTAASSAAPGVSAGFGRTASAPVYAAGGATTAGTALTPSGKGAAHNNRQPFVTLNFCIALQGVFPPRP